MSKELNILNDFNTLDVPLSVIAEKNNCSLHYVIKVVHYAKVGKYKETEEAKKCLC